VRTRAVNDTYTLTLKALRSGNREGAMNLINRDPVIARYVLIRLLRVSETQALAREFADMFPSNAASEIEIPLARFHAALSRGQQTRTLDWLEIASRSVEFVGATGTPVMGARAAEDLQSAREYFKSIGFTDGEAFCLRANGFRNYVLSRLSQPELAQRAIDLTKEAQALYASVQNFRGEILCLMALSNIDAKAKGQYMAEAKMHARSLGEPFFNWVVADPGEQKLSAWQVLDSQPGLVLSRYQNLLEDIDMTDSIQAKTLETKLDREPDTLVAAIMYYRVFLNLGRRGEDYYAQSMKAFNRALELMTPLDYDGSPFSMMGFFPALYTLHNVRAQIERNIGHYAQSETSLLAAMASLENSGREFDKVSGANLDVVNRLGAQYALLGDLPKAEVKLRQALDIAGQLDPQSAGASVPLLSLALVHAEMGNLRLAEEELRRGSRIQTPGAINRCLSVLAEIHIQYGLYAEAVNDLEQTEPEFRGFPNSGIRNADYGSRLRLLTMAWLRIGDLAKAERYAREFEMDYANPQVALSGSIWLSERNLLGIVLTEQKRYPEAERYFRNRLAALTAANRTIEEANAFKGLGRVYRLQGGRNAEAIDQLRRALDRYHQRFQTRDEMEVYLEMGQIALNDRDPVQSEAHFNQALQIANETQSPQGKWSAQSGLASLAKATGNIPSAIAHLKSAVQAIETISSRLNAESIKSMFVENRIGIYDELIRLLIAAGRSEEALEYAQRRRSQSFAEAARLIPAPLSSSAGDPLRSKLDSVESQLMGRQRALTDQLSNGKRDTRLIALLNDEMSRVRSEYTDLMERLQQQNRMEASHQELMRTLSVTEIQNSVVRSGEVLIDYVVTGDEVFAFVISPATFKLVPLRIRREALANEIQKLREPFERLKNGESELLHMDKFDVNRAYQLYRNLIEPLGPEVKSARRLIIIPDDVLHYLPFECLAASAVPTHAAAPTVKYGEYRDVDWLMKSHSVVYGISEESLRSGFRHATPDSGTILAFGNPKLNGQAERGGELPLLGSLPGSASEAKAVAVILGRIHSDPTVLTEAEASESEFIQKGPQAGYIHFATHAIVSEQQPYYSALLLAPDAQNDGWLQAFEIMRMSLNARLVTLSGCDSGLGKLYKGEGLLSMRRAFLLAGAQSVVVSLWSTEDSVPNFMGDFYTNISNGADLPDALVQAKIQHLKHTTKLNGAEISLSHPYFWATFTLASVN